MRLLRSVLSVVCVVVATMAAAVAPAAAVGSAPGADSTLGAPQPRGPYYLINAHSGLGMVVKGASTANGALAIQWPVTSGDVPNDMMVLEYEDSVPGLLRIKPRHMYGRGGGVHHDMCLAVRGASISFDAPIVQATCTYDSVNNDVWTEVGNPDNVLEVQFRNQRSGLCLVVQNASRDRGAQLIQHTCARTRNSLWRLQ